MGIYFDSTIFVEVCWLAFCLTRTVLREMVLFWAIMGFNCHPCIIMLGNTHFRGKGFKGEFATVGKVYLCK